MHYARNNIEGFEILFSYLRFILFPKQVKHMDFEFVCKTLITNCTLNPAISKYCLVANMYIYYLV